MSTAPTDVIQGVVRGTTIELQQPTRFAEGARVEVVLRVVKPEAESEHKSAAGLLADLPAEDPILDELERERRAGVYRELNP